MTWTEADIPDLSGRVAVVTGANGGLGQATADALVGAGAHVVIAARNQAKAAAAVEAITVAHPSGSHEIVELDLGSLSAVEQAAGEIVAGHDTVDILVNNAGLMAIAAAETVDGFEMQFGVNHLGHFAFTAHLLPALLRADRARVVTVTSTAHHGALSVKPERARLTDDYDAWSTYNASKLANFYFALGLDQKFRAAGVTAESLLAHPGLTNSDLQTTAVADGSAGVVGSVSEALAKRIGMSPRLGARPQLRAATDPAAAGGDFYAPRFVISGPAVRRPVLRRAGLGKAVDSLWEMSERETGVALAIPVGSG